MSWENVFERLESISGNVDSLMADVTNLKEKEKERGATGGCPTSLKSRSPHDSRTLCAHSCEWTQFSRDRTLERSWGDRDPAESPYFSLPIHFLDEDDDHNGSQLVEVSEEPIGYWKRMHEEHVKQPQEKDAECLQFPKLEATRTLKVDQVIKSLASQSAMSADRELVRIQTFVQDSIAPVSALSEQVSQPGVNWWYKTQSIESCEANWECIGAILKTQMWEDGEFH